ncbi:MAG TPA: hypothetical protein VGI95_14985 [Caulobacteraceae bacterium]|jgi:hypothetical protein
MSSTLPPDVTADALPLFVTIGFTGHRAVADPKAAEQLIEAALACVHAAVGKAADEPFAADYTGPPGLRLLIGAAPGTDRIAAAAWRAADYGELHTLYPFREPGGDCAYTDRPEKADPETRVKTPPLGEAWTGLDTHDLDLTPDQAHAEVARWIVRHAELLIGWWNGESFSGAGGAGDTMRKALERGIPVIWLRPGAKEPQLVDPSEIRHHADAAEAMGALERIAVDLTADALADLLAVALAAPGEPDPAKRDPEVLARRDYASSDPTLRRSTVFGRAQALADATLWRTYAVFERVAGRAVPLDRLQPELPGSLAAQPGFQRLRAASRQAAARAARLSDVHRSEQLLLIAIAIAAVFVGALPAVVPSWHAPAAGVEFAIGLVALGVAETARAAHRHRRWSDARRLAERLRAALATWPLGFDIADAHANPPQTWTEWRTRAVLRAAGPPRGWINRERLDDEAAWVGAQLIESQIRYHRRQGGIAENIERFVKWIEGGAFGSLMALLLVFLLLHYFFKAPEGMAGWVSLVSAVSPAVAAGCLALEATNGFGELALHSEHLEAEFEDIRAHLGDASRAPYHQVLRIVRRAAQLLVEDVDAWRDRLQRRRIIRGA